MKIVIPAYQPDRRLLDLIQEIQSGSDYEIIIVNDGSDLAYNQIFECAINRGCIVLTHQINQGKGAALRSAFQFLYDNDCSDSFICADCDGQHTWKDIQRVAEAVHNHPSSITLGCRKFVGKIPLKSLIGNQMTRIIFTAITGSNITDTQTGLRGFPAITLPWLIQLKGNRYEYEMNQLLEAKKAGFSFFCIPIETIYENNNKGSHFNPILDSVRIFLPIMKFSLYSLLCAGLDLGLLFLLNKITGSLLISVIGARAISSLTNYILNRNLVFRQSGNKKAFTLFAYYLLVLIIMSGNYILMSLFHEKCSLSLLVSKLLTECILFSFSYIIQHRIIFKNKGEINSIS